MQYLVKDWNTYKYSYIDGEDIIILNTIGDESLNHCCKVVKDLTLPKLKK